MGNATEQADLIIVGGGFYGSALAAHMAATRGGRVLLLERGDRLLGRASYANQARVHCGYHYPRGLMTALRSRVNLPRFVADWQDCIDDDFAHYYGVARRFSNVSAAQFELFCARIGAPLEAAPREVERLFDADLVERVWRVREPCFDAVKLRNRIEERLAEARVEVRTNVQVERIGPAAEGLWLESKGPGGGRMTAREIWLCTYSALNRVLAASALPTLPLKHELTEMALVQVPPELRDLGVTIMCGPFFSLLPFPALGLCTLSHVRYTPHGDWQDGAAGPIRDPFQTFESAPRESAVLRMVKDARRFLPAIERVVPQGSLWETKTVLPMHEVDDGRPILFRRDHGLPGLHLVMGSKIDNVYDVMDLVDA